jgi:hypothetical protein
MKRVLLALAAVAGLVLGTALSPAVALGDTHVTLTCDDGTSMTVAADADTVLALTQAVQGMIDYPAGLTCTLVQNPLGVLRAPFSGVALASPGQSPFIVGGGRWQVPCGSINFGGGGGGGGAVPGGVVARARGAWNALSGPSSASPAGLPTDLVWVNIAVNVHQSADGGFFGTLNETIPANQFCDGGLRPVGESHFTSKPTPPFGCLQTSEPTGGGPPGQGQGYPRFATVTSHVTETSGLPFPGAALGQDIHFSFIDNGNPGHQSADDKLQGPPAFENSVCPTAFTDPAFDLLNGNISVHP